MNRMMKKALMITTYYASSSSSSLRLRVMRRSICSEAGFAVKVRSESLVKPSPSTPLSRRHFKLSLIDAQFSPTMYTSFVLFYPSPNNNSNSNNNNISVGRLRDSLSKALSHMYPLAGRIHLQQHAPLPSSIDCSDQGVVYLEAEANQHMLHFLLNNTSKSKAPDAELLRRLSPPRPKNAAAFFSDAPPPLASVQTTAFPCGGMAVGVCVSHLIGDAQTIATLLNKWASVSSGAAEEQDNIANVSDMAGRSLFPMENFDFTNIAPYDWGTSTSTSTRVVMERLVFKREAISRLKSQVGGQISNPSRSLVIFGLIWKAAMEAHMINTNKSKQPSTALVTVNLRPRFNTPLPDNVMGNILWSSAAQNEEQVEVERLVGLLRESVDQVDGEFVEKLTGEEGQGQIRKWVDERGRSSGGRVKEYHFSSALRVGFNEADFGWGRPLWVTYLGISEMLFPNFVILTDGGGGGGGGGDGAVEAWVSLDENEMALFRQHPQLLNYALINPKLLT